MEILPVSVTKTLDKVRQGREASDLPRFVVIQNGIAPLLLDDQCRRWPVGFLSIMVMQSHYVDPWIPTTPPHPMLRCASQIWASFDSSWKDAPCASTESCRTMLGVSGKVSGRVGATSSPSAKVGKRQISSVVIDLGLEGAADGADGADGAEGAVGGTSVDLPSEAVPSPSSPTFIFFLPGFVKLWCCLK